MLYTHKDIGDEKENKEWTSDFNNLWKTMNRQNSDSEWKKDTI